jgi:hypothetical protein
MKTTFMMFFIAILFIWPVGLSYGQSEEIKVKESFIRTIQQEFDSLKEWGKDEKDNPLKSIEHWERDDTWHAYYDEYYDFQYDIQKTSSIVSPFIGIVTFRGYGYGKSGKTKEACLNSEWVKIKNAKPTLKYAYQDGVWVIKEKPPVYRKH